MKTSNPLSFDLNRPDSLEHWLNNLKKLNNSQASSELHQLLQKLRQNPPTPLTKLAILDQLIGPTRYYADQLEILVVSESIKSKPLAIKTAKLSSQLLSNLSLNYGQICKSSALDRQQQHTAFYHAFQLIGLSFCKQAVFKQCPSSRLWKKSAELYRQAFKSQLLEQPVPKTTPFQVTQKNLMEVLQRNLLFSICNPYHFQSNCVSQLFKFADRYCALLQISSPNQSANFIWLLNQAAPPRPYSNTLSPVQEAIYINSEAIAKQLTAQNAFNFSAPELNFLQQRLTGYREIMDSIIPSAPKQYQLILDYAQILINLNHYAAVANIRRISAESTEAADNETLLQLEPLNAPARVANKQTNQTNIKVTPQAPATSVFNTRFNHFVVASTPLITLHIDHPILLITASETVQLGFIKQAILSSANNTQRILIELVAGQIENVNLTMGTETMQAILIKQDSGSLEVLLPPANYQNNTKVSSNARTLPGEYCLDKLLEITPYFVRYQLVAY